MVLTGCWSVMMKSTLGRRARSCAWIICGNPAATPLATAAFKNCRLEMLMLASVQSNTNY
jgi:hypothetical protein